MDSFNAFDVEDSIIGEALDPYPELAAARRRGSVQRVDGGLGETLAGSAGTYMVYGHDQAVSALRSADTFSSASYLDVLGDVMGRVVLAMDGKEHRRHRALIAQAFRPRALQRWERELIAPLIDELIDRFVAEGRAELVRQFTVPFPIAVIARMLGLPRRDTGMFLRRSLELISVSVNWERGVEASQALRAYLKPFIEARRREPRDDLISELVIAEEEAERLSDEEILPFLLLLLPAGAETTMRALGNLLVALLRHPSQLNAVRDDRQLLPQAIEEALRWEPPLLLLARRATRDTQLGGVSIAAGSNLVISLAAANRDDTRWGHPDRYDLHREAQSHVAFGSGPHLCLGLHLARLEMRLAVERLLDRLPDLRVDPDAEPAQIRGEIFRSPPSLPVIFGTG
ncbi:MAG: cytochrome P450 [Nitriliruptorales bacterium]|nr:cytochrome P450 [Nitriliruptorales bacterium]